MIFVMAKTGNGLNKQPATPHGIIDLELAYSRVQADTIIKAWTAGSLQSEDYITVARTNTYWDFLFLIFYATFLYLLCKKIAASYESALNRVGNNIAGCVLLAGVLDAFENIGMLQTLGGSSSDLVAKFTASCSSIKWILVIITLAYIIVAGSIALFKKKSLNGLN